MKAFENSLVACLAVLCCLVSSGSGENGDLTFNLATWKPLPQSVETVCSCPIDQVECQIPSQMMTKPAEKSLETKMSHLLTAFKSLFVNVEQKKQSTSTSLLSAMQEKEKTVNKKEWPACHIEKVIECKEEGLRLNIVDATLTNQDTSVCSGFYGSSVKAATPPPMFGKCNNTDETFAAISKRCNGKSSCSLSTDLDELKSICECQNFKYLQVSFNCLIKHDDQSQARSKRQADSYLKGRQRAFSRLLMIGLYPTYFGFGLDESPPAVPERPVLPPTLDYLVGGGGGDPFGVIAASTGASSLYPSSSVSVSAAAYNSQYGSYGSFGASSDAAAAAYASDSLSSASPSLSDSISA